MSSCIHGRNPATDGRRCSRCDDADAKVRCAVCYGPLPCESCGIRDPRMATMDNHRGVPISRQECDDGFFDEEACGCIPCANCHGFRAPDTSCATCAGALAAAKERIETAEAERDEAIEARARARCEVTDALSALSSSERRVGELERALRPFAHYADMAVGESRGLADERHTFHGRKGIGVLRLSDCIGARKALSGGEGGK